MTSPHIPLRLRIDGDALVANWRALGRISGAAACGAALKANAYGLGAREAGMRLANAGCRDFFVATWAEADSLAPWIGDASASVLHGACADDLRHASGARARPVLNTAAQAARWREVGRPCDIMIDTGINRLGLTPAEAASGLLDGLQIETLMSHLACADEDVAENQRQRRLFAEVAAKVPARRLSLANSAGIFLGSDYAFGLTRPGLALFGGIPRREAEGLIRPVFAVEAQVIQRRTIGPGDSVGYNCTFTAEREMEIAILNIGYADGYLRAFSGRGRARIGDDLLPVLGRVSMDLTAICVDGAAVGEGDWVSLDYDLPAASAQSGLSQYELLTTLGSRFERIWS